MLKTPKHVADLQTVESIRERALRRFTRAGLSAHAAGAVVDECLDGELRGRRLHGLNQLPQHYERISQKKAEPQILQELGANALIDGGDGLGPVVASHALELALEMAGKHGNAIVGVRNKFTFVNTGYYAHVAARRGFVLIVTSVAPSGMAPYGGATKVLGTNPLAIGIPTGGDPFVLDMALSATTMGSLKAAMDGKRTIAEGHAVDKAGKATVDAAAAIEGALLPFGGYRGSGLALAVELLAGAMLGMKAGNSKESRRGMLFLVINPAFWGDTTQFVARVDATLNDVRSATPADGFEKVAVPGDRGWSSARTGNAHGLPVSQKVAAFLDEA